MRELVSSASCGGGHVEEVVVASDVTSVAVAVDVVVGEVVVVVAVVVEEYSGELQLKSSMVSQRKFDILGTTTT